LGEACVLKLKGFPQRYIPSYNDSGRSESCSSRLFNLIIFILIPNSCSVFKLLCQTVANYFHIFLIYFKDLVSYKTVNTICATKITNFDIFLYLTQLNSCTSILSPCQLERLDRDWEQLIIFIILAVLH